MEKSPGMLLSQKANAQLHELIFSESSRFVLLRHGCVWLARYLFLWMQTFVMFSLVQDQLTAADLSISASFVTAELGFEMLFTYTAVYLVLPYLKKYHGKLLMIAGLIFYCFAAMALQYLMCQYINGKTTDQQPAFLQLWGYLWGFVNFGPLAMGSIFLVAKTARNSFIEIRMKDQLVVANAEAELKLLNNQVQPHFLFNALNLIYSYTLKRSAFAKDAVRQLYDMMRYMIYDCSSCLVPLDRELEMIDGYIALQNGRFGNRLEMSKAIYGRTDGLMIPPQLLLPCIENCYKHGAGVSRGKQWIEMSISVQGRKFELLIRNSKTEIKGLKGGIGLSNLRRRLELIYGNNFKLDIRSTPDTYAVNLQLELEDAPAYNNTLQHA